VRILVLGGTSFVGRAIVTQALANGDEVTLFNRGKTGPDLFPDLERLVGDRSTGDYQALADRRWDAVVDVTGYVPRHVREAADAVGDGIRRYLFISTGSVYDPKRAAVDMTEDSPRLAPERGTEEIDENTYGETALRTMESCAI
jgi:2'-hydroxyisoflavone reductase